MHAGGYTNLLRIQVIVMPDTIETLTKIIEMMREEWGDQSLAWAGECGDFADVVWRAARDEGIAVEIAGVLGELQDNGCEYVAPVGVTLELLRTWGVLSELNHAWLMHAGRHFDAATPEGVLTPFELRHFKQVAVEVLREKQPEVLASLSAAYEYWRDAVRLTDEFLMSRYGTLDVVDVLAF
jgi:hypothetical protein